MSSRNAEQSGLEDLWVRVHDWQVHTLTSSDAHLSTGIPIVLITGLAIGGYTAVPLATELAKRHTVYAPDLPGYARSSKPDGALDISQLADAMARWMDALGLSRVVLAGSSFGSQIAAEFAVRYPQRINGLVLIGPTTDPAARSVIRYIFRFALNSSREVTSTLGMMRDYFESGPLRMARTAEFALSDRMEQKLPRVQAPTVIIRGERDPLVPQRWAEEAARLLPRGRLIVVRDKAHGIDRNAAPTVCDTIDDFVSSLTRAKPTRGSTGDVSAA